MGDPALQDRPRGRVSSRPFLALQRTAATVGNLCPMDITTLTTREGQPPACPLSPYLREGSPRPERGRRGFPLLSSCLPAQPLSSLEFVEWTGEKNCAHAVVARRSDRSGRLNGSAVTPARPLWRRLFVPIKDGLYLEPISTGAV